MNKFVLFIISLISGFVAQAQTVISGKCDYCNGSPKIANWTCPYCNGTGKVAIKPIGKYKYYLAKVPFDYHKIDDLIFYAEDLVRETSTTYYVENEYDSFTYSKSKIKEVEYEYYELPELEGAMFVAKDGEKVRLFTAHVDHDRLGYDEGLRIYDEKMILLHEGFNTFALPMHTIEDYRYEQQWYHSPTFDNKGNILEELEVYEDYDHHSILYIQPKNILVVDGKEYTQTAKGQLKSYLGHLVGTNKRTQIYNAPSGEIVMTLPKSGDCESFTFKVIASRDGWLKINKQTFSPAETIVDKGMEKENTQYCSLKNIEGECWVRSEDVFTAYFQNGVARCGNRFYAEPSKTSACVGVITPCRILEVKGGWVKVEGYARVGGLDKWISDEITGEMGDWEDTTTVGWMYQPDLDVDMCGA